MFMLTDAVVERELVRDYKISYDKNTKDNILDGKKFVITGTIDNYSRDELKDLIIQNGGKVTGSVSKKTDIVLCGKNPGSKRDKAQDLGIEIYEDQKLYDFILI